MKARGFTLLEVLVAIAIFAVVSAMAYGTLGQVLRTKERVDDERAFWNRLSLAMLRIEDDVAQARPRPVRDGSGAQMPPFMGTPTDPRAAAGPQVEFTRGGVLLVGPAQRSDLERVGYHLKEGTLYRLRWTLLDRAPDARAVETPLLADVEDLRLRFVSATGVWSETWPPSAPAAQNTELPRGVEMALRVKGRGEFRRLFLVHE